jgi:hypothetical protein
MKQYKRFALLVSALALSILACSLGGLTLGEAETVLGSGNVVEETREVSGVSGVNLATIGDMTIELGNTESLRIEAEENLMDYLETGVRGGKLTIETSSNVRLEPTKPIHYTLTVTSLDRIEISSVGDIEAPDLEADQFSINISSTGDLTMGELRTNELDVDMSSTGSVDIAGGEVATQNLSSSSTGNYTAQDLASDEAEVRLNSTGSATIWVRETLKANLSSTGDLRYRGDPTVDATTSSTGDVIQVSE